MRELSEIRSDLDEVDYLILNLFEKRMDLSKEVAIYKKVNNIPILDSSREKQLLEDKTEKTNNDEYKKYVYMLFSKLMDLSKDLQIEKIGSVSEKSPAGVNSKRINNKQIKVCYQGIEGSYGYQAVNDYFENNNAVYENAKTFADVFKAVSTGECDYGIVPVENSSTGIINESYDLFEAYDCSIVGEYELLVEHCLLATKGAKIEDIKEVYSHPQGLLQCQDFIEQNGFATVMDENTATSAAMVASLQDKSKAAIAAKCNADLYGLEVLAENINYNKKNVTRFYIIGKVSEIDESCNKTSIIFSVKHEAGTLFRAISAFAKHDLSITMICSRPIVGSDFEYKFFLDFLGCTLDENVKAALSEIYKECQSMHVLGCYRHR